MTAPTPRLSDRIRALFRRAAGVWPHLVVGTSLFWLPVIMIIMWGVSGRLVQYFTPDGLTWDNAKGDDWAAMWFSQHSGTVASWGMVLSVIGLVAEMVILLVKWAEKNKKP